LEKALIIKGSLPDLSDLLRIARAEGRKVLKVDRVKVNPVVTSFNGKDYIVVVSPDHNGHGCSKSPDVGRRNKAQR